MMKIAKDRVIDPNNQFYPSEPNNDGALSSDISVDLGPNSERDEPPDQFELQLKKQISRAILRDAHLDVFETISLSHPLEDENANDFSSSKDQLVHDQGGPFDSEKVGNSATRYKSFKPKPEDYVTELTKVSMIK